MPASPAPPATPRQRILNAACALFLEQGYRVAMDAVAQRAGVAKQTVYAHFHSKDDLFRMAVQTLVQPLHACLEPQRGDLAASLRALARVRRQQAGDPAHAALGRMLVAEAPRFPRAARALYRAGSGAVLERLAERLRQSMRRGELRCDDPRLAAEMFLSMLDGMDTERHLLGVRGRGRKAQDAWASRAVKVFLRAYAPDGPSPDHPHRMSP